MTANRPLPTKHYNLNKWLGAASIIAIIAGISAAASPASAQTVVPDGTNLATLGSPAAGDVWNLRGSATLFDPAAVAPSFALDLSAVGASGLTIVGANGGSTITLNDGAGHFGYFGNATASAVTLNLSNITITGGSEGASGGAIASSGDLTLNTSGAVTLSNDETTTSSTNGGGIWSGGKVTIVGGAAVDGTAVPTTLTLKSDSVGWSGGGVYAAAGILLTGSYNSILLEGDTSGTLNASGSGGAFYTTGALTISATVTGDVTVTGNTAASNGAFWASQGVIIDPTTMVGGTMAFTNNAGNAGGAIYTDSAITIGGSYGNIVFADNTGRNGRGGALRAASGITIDTTVSGTLSVTGNSALGDGGALVATGGFVTLTGSYGGIDFSNNTSGKDNAGGVAVAGVQCGGGGGAICAGNGNLTISATVADTMTFAGNTAVNGNGGALAANNGNVILDAGPGNISLTGNTAIGTTIPGNGGAIYSTGSTTITGNAITLSDNTATAGAGGAVYTGGDFALNPAGAATISGNSAGTQGGALWIGGDAMLTATGGDITFSGNRANGQANAIYLNNTAGTTIATLNAAAGRSITFFDPIQNNAANGLVTVTVTGPGAVVFDGAQTTNHSQVYGETTVQGGTFAVQNNAVYGMLVADLDPSAGQTSQTRFTVNSGVTLAGGIQGEVRADQFTLGGTLDISGSTALGHPAGTATGGYSNFTITSSTVTFAPGSQILFNTYLNDAGTQLTDHLTLNLNGGATTGTATVIVTNTGALGAVTVGSGIQLVQTNGGSSAGAFELGNRVEAGAYKYNLFYNGVGADAADGNWYLRSTGIRPEVPTDAVVPGLASRLGLAMLGTSFTRTGNGDQFCVDDVEARKSGVYTKERPTNVQCNTLLWGRVFGETGAAGSGGNGNGGFGSAGPAYTFDYSGFQTGADLYRTARDNAGLYAGAAVLQSDVRTASGGPAGRVGMDAYGVGSYWTHRDPTGWYTDLVLQGNWYENIRAHSVTGQGLGTHGWGITASAETGYVVAFGGGYSVIPQGQLIYQRTSINGGTDQFSQISYNATDEIYGRLGARFAKGWLTNDGRTVTAWAETNFWHQFGDDAQTTFTNLQGINPTTFTTSLGGTWAQVGLGLSGQLTRNVSVFGNADYNVALSQPGHSLGGRAGVRVNW